LGGVTGRRNDTRRTHDLSPPLSLRHTGGRLALGASRRSAKFQTPMGLYLSAAFRLVLGVALFLAAPTSRNPELIRTLGVIIIVIGVITRFFGVERYRRLLDRISAKGSAFIRRWAVLALALSFSLVYGLFLDQVAAYNSDLVIRQIGMELAQLFY